jgi:hypothetical protein
VFVKDEEVRRQYQASSDPLGLQKTQQLRTRMLATKRKEWEAKWEKKKRKKGRVEKDAVAEARQGKKRGAGGGVGDSVCASIPPPPPMASARSIQAMPAPVPRSNPLVAQRSEPQPRVPVARMPGQGHSRAQSLAFPQFYAGQAVPSSHLEALLHGAPDESDEDFGEGPSRRARLQWETARSAPL